MRLSYCDGNAIYINRNKRQNLSQEFLKLVPIPMPSQTPKMTDLKDSPLPHSVQIGGLQVQGFVNPATDVANFLGIQYATIPARFRQPRIIDLSSLTGVLDATQYGPRCPQAPRLGSQASPLFQGVRRSNEYPLDEFGCLRLNIYRPPATHHGPLPVVVWIHGGGFVFGDGNSEFDGTFLVRHSIDIGKPVIYVAMNYRLGHFGFLSSRELEAEAVKNGETPFLNMAFCDQRTALLWVQKHIHHFGGDPANVTIAGESAGGLSVLAHLRSNVPVCQRGIIMSSPNLDYPQPEEVQANFDQLVTSTGTSLSASDEEKLAALRALTAEDIVRLMDGQFATPLYDKEWFTYQDVTKPTAGPAPIAPWVKGVIAGSTKDEAAIFGIGIGWLSWSFNQFEERVRFAVPDAALAAELMDAYGLGPTSSSETNFRAFLDIATDCNFSGLPFIVAEQPDSSNPPVSLYRFDQPDTFDGSPFKGFSYHSLDNAYFCRLPSVAGPKAEEATRATADKLSEAVLTFTYAAQPWETYLPDQRVMVFNGKDSGLTRSEPKNRWRKITEAGDPLRAMTVKRAGHRLMGLRHCSL